jgi:hypothetical protein
MAVPLVLGHIFCHCHLCDPRKYWREVCAFCFGKLKPSPSCTCNCLENRAKAPYYVICPDCYARLRNAS